MSGLLKSILVVAVLPMTLSLVGQTATKKKAKPEDSNRAAEDPAIAKLRAKAVAGDAEAQESLGLDYAYGSGVPQDNAEAARWYRKAADQGDDIAQTLGAFRRTAPRQRSGTGEPLTRVMHGPKTFLVAATTMA